MAETNFQRIKGYTYCTYCETIFDARQQSRWCKHAKEYWEPIYYKVTIGTPVRPVPKKRRRSCKECFHRPKCDGSST